MESNGAAAFTVPGSRFRGLIAPAGKLSTAEAVIDEEAVYLSGGSFGGFLIPWALGTTDRFDAAVDQRGVDDPTGFYGSTDGTYKLVEGDFDATRSTKATFLWEQSAVSRASDVDSPSLLIHSERGCCNADIRGGALVPAAPHTRRRDAAGAVSARGSRTLPVG